ncbi:MAG TPA: hypothetical protein VIX90_05435 [Edaphobacter sp.]
MPTLSHHEFPLHRLSHRAMALLILSLASATCTTANAQAPQPIAQAAPLSAKAEKNFDKIANDALLAMRSRAAELNITGVALVAYFQGDTIQSWSSKMLVVGRMKDLPTDAKKGSNLLAIAYSKAAEMADTLKDSGSQIRPAMTGEVGWTGGVILRGKTGYLIGAFSGGKSEDDVKVSKAGAEVLKSKL